MAAAGPGKGAGADLRPSIYSYIHNDVGDMRTLGAADDSTPVRVRLLNDVVMRGKRGNGMAGHRGSQWTAEEDRRLLDMVGTNKSWVLISAALSRSVKSVRDRARHLERRTKTQSTDLDGAGTARIGV